MSGSAQVDTSTTLLRQVVTRWRLHLGMPVACSALAFGLTFLIPSTYTARTSFIPPQQQGGLAAAALASLGALSNLAGAAVGLRVPADQYVALLQSRTVTDRLIDKFDLMKVYDKDLRDHTRQRLLKNTNIISGKKDGLIVVEVDDENPQRAADIANRYVDELRSLTSELALTEAQQRRVFFQGQVNATKGSLARAQEDLQKSGFDPGALKTEPKAAAETYARLRAEMTAAEVKLRTLSSTLANNAIEIQQQRETLAALRSQLAKVEGGLPALQPAANYINKYREFKYQESLFELFSRQYELARLDESRESALIQVVDKAVAPELRSWPKRSLVSLAVFGLTLLGLLGWTSLRHVLHIGRPAHGG